MKKLRLLVVVMFAAIMVHTDTYAQVSYTASGPVAGYLPFLRKVTNSSTTGSTNIHPDVAGGGLNVNSWSAAQALPFSFNYFGNAVTHFCVSKNGLLTFDTTVANSTVNTNLNENKSLPYANLPAKTIAFFWGDFAGINSGDHVYVYTEGTSPNRQFYVQLYGYKIDAQTIIYNFLVLEETTNKIYMIDGSATPSAAGSYTLGVQETTTKAVHVPGSPNIQLINSSSDTLDDDYYTFTPFNLPTNDAGIASIDTPTTYACNLSNPLVVTLTNYGTATLTSATIKAKVNASVAITYSWSGSIAPYSTQQVNIGTATLASGDLLTVWAEAPNSSTDLLASNDTVKRNVYTAMSGSYTIGGVGADYASFTAASAALSQRGICGNVTLNVASATTFTEQVVFNTIPGSGPSAGVTIKGNNSTLKYLPTTTAAPHILRLSNVNYFTIDSLKLELNGSATGTYGWLIHLMNSHNITITHCNLLIPTTVTTSNAAGIVVSGSTTSNTVSSPVTNLLVSDNTITGGYYPFRINSLGINNTNNKFINNTVKDFYIYGTYLSDVNGILVKGNDYSRPTRTGVTTFYGVYLTGNSNNTIIDGNRIHDPVAAATTNTSTVYGINISSADAPVGSENIIMNNLIYNMNCNGTIYALYNSSSDGTYFYNNTVSLDATGATAGITRGFYQTGLADNIKFINNIISITRGGSGIKHGIYLGTNTSTVTSSNNNVYMASAGTGAQYYGYYNSDIANLADWKAAGYGANSTALLPVFISASNPTPRSGSLNGVAVVLAVVTTDINGVTRNSTNPDLGAIEFTPPANEASLVSIDTPSLYPCVLSPLVVTIKNVGSSTLSSLTIKAKVNATVTTTYSWSGTLAPLASAQVNIGTPTIVNNDTLTVWTESPNSALDSIPSNDTISRKVITALSGTYTVGGIGADFANFNAVKTALDAKGICSSVIFNINNTVTFSEQVTFGRVGGVSSTNTVTFKGHGATIKYAPTLSSDAHVIKLDGADYFTFDSLNVDLDLSGAPTYGWMVQILSGSDNNKFTNCNITSSLTSTSSNFIGVLFTGSATSNSTSGSYDGNEFINNTINGGYYSIRVNGGTGAATNFKFIGNKINDSYLYETYFDGITNALFSQNDLSRPTRTGFSTFYGIYVAGTSVNNKFERNLIHHPFTTNTATTSTAYGIYFTGADATVGNENLVYNNIIYKMESAGSVYAIYNSSSDGAHYYYNTLSLDDASATAGLVRGFYQLTLATNIKFINNNISITRGGSGVKHGIYLGTNTSVVTSNNNNIYVNSLGSGTQSTGYFDGNDYATLANWQTANSGAYDANSVSINPLFTNIATNNYIPRSAVMNNVGVPVSGITTDYSNNTRSVTATDPGAFEYTPPANDAGITALVSPVSQCAGTADVKVNIKNFGATAIDSVLVKWTLNNVTQTTYNHQIVLASGADTTVTLGSFTIITDTGYDIKAWTSEPNGANDATNYNDTVSVQNFKSALTGTYTIGGVGADYANFTAMAADLNNRGLCGAVTFDVNPAAGPYTDQIALTDVFNTSAVNTVKINGHGATITYSPSINDQRHIVKLDGTDYVTIDSLNFVVDPAATYGWCLHLIGGADHNTFTNNTFTTVANSTSTNYQTIVVSGSTTSATTGTSASYNTFTNNNLNNGYYGITLTGLSTGRLVSNNFSNNIVKDFYSYGVYSAYNDSLTVSNNDISRPTRTNSTTAIGVGVISPSANVWVERNKIHDLFASFPTSTSTSYGIYHSGADATSGNENVVANNLVYNINHNGTIYGLYNSSSDGVHYFYNTISIDNVASTAGTTRGFYQTTLATNIEFKNNIITITRGGTGAKHVLYFGTTTSTIASNYNSLYINSAGTGNQSIGYYSADQATMTAWQAANSSAYDGNSVNIAPKYYDIANHNLQPTAISINNLGTPIAKVTTDINGSTRSGSTPDLGAYEFTPPNNDVRVSAIIAPAGTACGDTGLTVTVTLTNLGINNQSSIPVTVEITGAGTTTLTGTYSTTLVSETSVNFTLPGTFSTLNGGTFNIKAYTSLSGDQNTGNDTTMSSVDAIALIANPIGTDGENCGPGTIGLSATGGGRLDWFTSLSATTPIATGGTYSPTVSATTPYYVQATPINSDSLLTNFDGLTTFQGNFFDLTAKSDLFLDSIDMHTTATSLITVKVYYKKGTYLGFETTASAWTLLDTADIVGKGLGIPTRMPFKQSLNIPKDSLYGIFVIVTNGGNICYETGVARAYEDNAVKFQAGAGTDTEFGGSVIQSRTWNGRLYYRADGCPSFRTKVTAIVNPIPDKTISATGNTTFCAGENVVLNSPIETNVTYQWRLDGSNILGAVGSQYTAFNSGNYSFVATSNKGCIDSSSALAVDAVAYPSATIFPQGNKDICQGDSLQLTANAGTGLTYVWSVDGVASGDTNMDLTVNQTGVYRVNVKNAIGCETESDSVEVIVHTLPSAISGVNISICDGDDAVLTITGPMVRWYDAKTGGNLLSDLNTYTITAPAATDSVYVAEFDGLCESPRTVSIYEVKPLPAAPTVSDATLCDGDSTTLLATVNTGENVEWFDAASAGNSLLMGVQLATGGLSTTTKYFAETELNGCISSNRTEVTVTVNAIPANPMVADSATCFGTSVDVVTVPVSGTVLWFIDDVTSTPLFEGDIYTTGMITVNDSLYVQGIENGCYSPNRQLVVVKPIALPDAPIPTGDFATCQGTNITISATANGTIEWYNLPSNGNLLGTGTTLLVPSVISSTVVYAQTNDGECISDRTPVIIVSNDLPSADFTITSNEGARIKFGVTTPENGIVYNWNFGDSKTGTGDSIYHDYTANANYTVTLTATNPVTGCQSITTLDLDMQRVGINPVDGNELNLTVYPNPYQGTATVSYNLTDNSKVTLEVYDVAGRKVTTLVNGTQNGGTYTVALSTAEFSGVSGVYYVRLTVNGQTANIKVIDLGK